MTHKLTVTVETKAVEAQKGIKPGLMRVSITDVMTDEVAYSKDVEGVVADFEGVADGDYVIAVCRLDTNGNPMGEVISKRFIVEVEPVVMVDVPTGFSVAIVEE